MSVSTHTTASSGDAGTTMGVFSRVVGLTLLDILLHRAAASAAREKSVKRCVWRRGRACVHRLPFAILDSPVVNTVNPAGPDICNPVGFGKPGIRPYIRHGYLTQIYGRVYDTVHLLGVPRRWRRSWSGTDESQPRLNIAKTG